MSYYNPYLDDLKDERIEILEEKLIGDTKHIYAILHRKDINTCLNCSSIHTIAYGKRKRFINCDLLPVCLTVLKLNKQNTGHA